VLEKLCNETILPAKEGNVHSTDHREGVAITFFAYFITFFSCFA
jgi:hypothetical protein